VTAAAAAPSCFVTVAPLNYLELRKDSWLDAPTLEKAIGVSRRDPMYRIRVLELRDEIRRHTGILSRIEDDRLRLMTDAEAYRWNAKLADARVAGLVRCASNTALIDRSQLTDAECVEAEHAARKISLMASAARREQRQAERFADLLCDDDEPV
jgi:hypothetical protein